MNVKIIANEKANPPGKLADAELHFDDGVLEGLRLVGFAVWERRVGGGRNVTFPARQYSVNGDRRSFSLLRPIAVVSNRYTLVPRARILDVVEQAIQPLDVGYVPHGIFDMLETVNAAFQKAFPVVDGEVVEIQNDCVELSAVQAVET